MEMLYNEVLNSEACGELFPIVWSSVYHKKEIVDVLMGLEFLE